MFVNFNILNQLGSPAINSNTFANRPAAGQTGRLFVSTDTFEIYRDNGTTWDLIGGPGSSTITGTGTATQVAYFTSSQAIGSSANLFWDNTSGFLGVATATPTARIEAVKTDGIGIYANFTTNAGSGSSTTGLWAKNVTNSSGFAAVIEETTPNATAGQYPLLIKHSLSSGTAGVGMGTGLHFQLPDDAGTFKTTQLTIETIDAAAATYKTRYRFNVQNNGTGTPVAYINATGIGIFTATPGAALDVHSTGTIAQFNTTSATGNTYIAFQRTGTGLWRVGDTYNGGNNFFELHNTVLGVDAMEFEAATNKSTFQAQQTYTTGLARGNYFDYNLSVAAGGSFSSPNAITALTATLDLTLAGSATIPSGARSGLDAYNTIAFTGAGTLTHNQGTQIRAYSNVTAGWAFNGSAVGTITHLAGLRALFPDNSGSAVNVTNNYALLLNDQTANTGTVTYTNRWGVYQEGASDLNYFAANTLIGTTVNSGARLDVVGGTGIRVNEDGSGTKVIQIRSNFAGVDPAINVSTNNALLLQTNNTERVRITNAGLVGIGTSLPKTNLDVAAVGNSKIIISSYFAGASAPELNLFHSNSNTLNTNTATVTGQILGQIVFSGVESGGAVDDGAYIQAVQEGSVASFRVPAYLSFATGNTTTNPTERLRITPDGLVGIGTSTPGSILTVQQASTASTFGLRHTASGNGYGWQYATTGTTTNDLILNSEFNGSFTERVRITSAGNFGLNTSSPNAYSGYTTLTINNNSTGSILDLDINDVRSAVFAVSSSGAFIGSEANLPTIFISNGTERARFTPGGNFLISTTTDAGQKLQVNGDQYTNGNVLVNQTSQGNGGTVSVNGTISIGTTTNGTQSSMAKDGVQRATGVSTGAGTIFTSFVQGMSSASCGYFIIYGDDNSANGFIDVVIARGSQTPVVISSSTVRGTPAARTYTTSTDNLQLAMGSGTYNVNVKCTTMGYPF